MEAICCAVCETRGSDSKTRKVCSQATTEATSSKASKKKVRQNRLKRSLLIALGRACKGAGMVSSAAGPVGIGLPPAMPEGRSSEGCLPPMPRLPRM